MPVANYMCRPSDDLTSYSLISCQIYPGCEKCVEHRGNGCIPLTDCDEGSEDIWTSWSDPRESVTQRIVLLNILNSHFDVKLLQESRYTSRLIATMYLLCNDAG